MPRRSTDHENIRTIQQSKGTYVVSMPIRIIRLLGWKQRQKVVVRKRGEGVEIVDWPVRPRKGT